MFTNAFLAKVASNLDVDFSRLGLLLGIPPEYIQRLAKTSEIKWFTILEVLFEWRKTSLNRASNILVEELVSALTTLKLMDVVEIVRKGEYVNCVILIFSHNNLL